MANWIVRWNFNKSSYSPGEQAFMSFWIENVGESRLYLSNLELDFDFGKYDLMKEFSFYPCVEVSSYS